MLEDLLIELGTEELPPVALYALQQHFATTIELKLKELAIDFASIDSFATPRRLAVLIKQCQDKQADKQIQRKGPQIRAAFDADGKPTKAAKGFARSCQCTMEQLEQIDTDKGPCLSFSQLQIGKSIEQLIPEIVATALDSLPIPKRMRWGSLDVQFVRPVHWLVMMYGDKLIPGEILAVQSGNQTYGHRFHAPEAITIDTASNYPELLNQQGRVIANFSQRKQIIREQIEALAESVNGRAEIDEDLLNEVCSMVEWPCAIMGSFDEEFLQIPDEALISSMKKHQKYFHLYDKTNVDQLLAKFITISNIESSNEDSVRSGNERVIRPRLSDAQFFWQQDLKTPVEQHAEALEKVVFQQKLGSIADKIRRLQKLVVQLAKQLKQDEQKAERAAYLCKTDLMSEMVGEFPDLQGIMGRHYALAREENKDIACAIDEHYRPRNAADQVTMNAIAQILAIADRVDTLFGIFAIGLVPTGDKDPFALRRAALGLLRTIIDNNLDLDLQQLFQIAASEYQAQGNEFSNTDESITLLNAFCLERLKGYLLDKSYTPQMFEAVNNRQVTQILDFLARIEAVKSFSTLEQAEALSAANKRIQNILKKAQQAPSEVNASLLKETAEQTLFAQIKVLEPQLNQLFATQQYADYLQQLASLKTPVDAFFDQVMVFDENIELQHNRIALLRQLQKKFIAVADIACLN